jgi:hypothetical protein
MTYRCDSGVCEATFEHPGPEEDCESIDGKCAHLMRAGWRPCWVRVEFESSRLAGKPFRPLFSRGGWLCPACVKRYGADLEPPKRKCPHKPPCCRSAGAHEAQKASCEVQGRGHSCPCWPS